MKNRSGTICALWVLVALSAAAARAADRAAAKAEVAALLAKLAEQNPRTTKATLEALGQSGEPRLVPFLKEYYMKSSAYVYQGKVVLKGPEKAGIIQLLDPLTGAPLIGVPSGEV